MTRPSAVDPGGVRIDNAAQRDAVQRYTEGTLSGEMAVMYCLEAVPDVDALLRRARRRVDRMPRTRAGARPLARRVG